MKLHTNLTEPEVRAVLAKAQGKGLLPPDLSYAVFAAVSSRTHRYGYDIQLGTWNQDSLPDGYVNQHGKRMRVRKVRNSGYGEDRYAATWHEWGWLIAEMFEADPESRWGDKSWGYTSAQDFNRQTQDQFLPVAD